MSRGVVVAVEFERLAAQQRLVNGDGTPSLSFTIYWQKVVEKLEQTLTDLTDTVAAIQAAQTAADNANAAAAAADLAATNAATATTELATADQLRTSYVDPTNIITASDAGTDATIAIGAHTRKYPQTDGSTVNVSVNAGNMTGLAYSTQYFVYYDDPTRAGGAVTYVATTNSSTAAQVGSRHLVGAVTTPAALGAPTPGGTVRPPGIGTIAYE